jgi:hypothetical protein
VALGPSWTPEQQVLKLRADLTRRHIPHAALTDDILFSVIERSGDLGVASDAISMMPRPAWVELMIGPFPVAMIEMTGPDDRADTDEWGHAG